MTSTGIRVFDQAAQRVDAGTADVDGLVATVPVASLVRGAYVVVWKAVSNDGHPINGSFTFQIGDGDQIELAGVGQVALASSATSSVLKTATRVLRFGMYVSFALLIAAGMWKVRGLRPLTLEWIRPTTVVAVTTSTVALLIDGPYVEGRSIGAAIDPQVLIETLSRTTGRSIAALIPAAFLLGWSVRKRQGNLTHEDTGTDRRSSIEIWGSAGLVSVLLAASGHGSAGRLVPIALTLTAVHVFAMSVWVGGVGFLALNRPDAKSWSSDDANNWSMMATFSVCALIVSGTFASWRQVGSVDALRETTYGRVLMAKLALVAVMLLLGAVHRRQRRDAQNASPLWSVRSLRSEAAAGLAVIGVASALSATIPARADLVSPISLTFNTATVQTDVTVDPARPGRNIVHLYVFGSNGRPRDITDIQVVLTHGATATEIEVDPTKAGTGHEEALNVQIPFTGVWTLEAKIFLNDFEVETASKTVEIR
jgi:copper transport protein